MMCLINGTLGFLNTGIIQLLGLQSPLCIKTMLANGLVSGILSLEHILIQGDAPRFASAYGQAGIGCCSGCVTVRDVCTCILPSSNVLLAFEPRPPSSSVQRLSPSLTE